MLEHFLNDMRCEKTGILQKFLEPIGEYNNIVEVKGTPQLITFQKIRNKTKIEKSQLDKYQRAAPVCDKFLFAESEVFNLRDLKVSIEKVFKIISKVKIILLEN